MVMARFKVKAKVVVFVETEFDEAEGEMPTASTVEFCMLEDLQNAGCWDVEKIKVQRFKRTEIPDG